jgi:predicted enzyme related to lactoylglutathione lyase
MGRVVHFEIAADDIERAKKFYEIFGWEITDSGMPGMEYWLAKTGEKGSMGIDGAIMPRSYSAQPIRNTIAVDNIDEMIEKVKASGGKVTEQKNTIPGVGEYVNAVDSEGNTFGMLQPLPRTA